MFGVRRTIGAISFFGACALAGQAQVPSPTAIATQTKALAGQYNSLAQYSEIGKLPDGQPMVVLRITAARDASKVPALCVVAGVDARCPSTPTIALQAAEALLRRATEDSVKRWLQNTVLYVVPVAAVGAYGRTSVGNVPESNLNTTPHDADHDGLSDEDGPDDLNNDGLLSWMRVRDTNGNWRTHPADARILVPAEAGQPGQYRLLQEGLDQDADRQFNEDGTGGVDFNRNWTWQYLALQSGSGPHPVSEVECRLLADWLHAHLNLQAVIVLGPHDNLSNPWKADPQAAQAQFPHGITESDGPFYKRFSDHWAATGAPTEVEALPYAATDSGAFLPWVQYHFGRYALGTPGWSWPALRPDSTLPADQQALLRSEDATVRILGTMTQEARTAYVAPWQAVQHPGFPGRGVEVGGLLPFKLGEIPADSLPVAAERQAQLWGSVASSLARVAIADVKVEKRSEGVYAVEVTVANTGLLPTHSSVGELNQWLKLVTLNLTLAEGQQLLAGLRLTKVGAVVPGKPQVLRYVVLGAGKLVLDAGAEHTGRVQREVVLN